MIEQSDEEPIGDLSAADVAPAPLTLLVIYTEQLEACREFYSRLGLRLVREQHGAGPVHYSVELGGAMVLELYPGTPDRATGRLRLGVTVLAGPGVPTGRELRHDPDGRVIDLQVEPGGLLSEPAVTCEATPAEIASVNAARAARGEPSHGEVSAEVCERGERALEKARRAGMA